LDRGKSLKQPGKGGGGISLGTSPNLPENGGASSKQGNIKEPYTWLQERIFWGGAVKELLCERRVHYACHPTQGGKGTDRRTTTGSFNGVTNRKEAFYAHKKKKKKKEIKKRKTKKPQTKERQIKNNKKHPTLRTKQTKPDSERPMWRLLCVSFLLSQSTGTGGGS